MSFAHIERLESRCLLSVGIYTVMNTNPSGSGSLAQAILNANAHPNDSSGPDRIIFQIPGTGVHVIQPTTLLPGITDAVIINAATQPGYAGTPLIQLDGSLAGSGADGLQVLAGGGGSTIRGLSITAFSANGIELDAGGDRIAGNYLGLDPTGAADRNGVDGLFVNNVGNNTIGGSSTSDRNVIMQLDMRGTGVTRNTVTNNYIGTDPTGTSARPGVLGASGIYLADGSNNRITGNLVSGNNGVGIFLDRSDTTDNLVANNFVGTDVTGTLALPNSFQGIVITDAPDNTIRGNLISGNLANGIWIYGAGAVGNSIEGNKIGTDVTGTKALGNAINGILLSDGTGFSPSYAGTPSHTQIGGTDCGDRNIISANGNLGIFIDTVATTESGGDHNVIQGNYIGTDITGRNALGNASAGIGFLDAAANLIGGTSYGAGNVVSANKQSGIVIAGGNSIGNTIQGNFIGTDKTGTTALGNAFNGINLNDASAGFAGASQTLIGGTCYGARNIISGNVRAGVRISDAVGGANNNRVQGNYIGTDVTGTRAIGNGTAGVILGDGSNNTVGGTSDGARNVISGNGVAGIAVVGAASIGDVIAGNYIGTNAYGTKALPNTGDGIFVGDGGSFTPAITGVPQSLTIGGTDCDAGNLISGNTGNGINVDATTPVVILNNDIGTSVWGCSGLGNGGDGVFLQNGAAGVIVGQPGDGNTIAFNGSAGVSLDPTAGIGNSIRGNSIFSNTALGIDLGQDGVTPNHNPPATSGPNLFQNFPVISNAKRVGFASVAITGSLTAVANTIYTLDFYMNGQPDPSGFGEGAAYFGTITVKTNASGVATFNVTLPLFHVPLTFSYLTATATSPAGSTSEFSQAVKLT